jgi:hypothetical protein
MRITELEGRANKVDNDKAQAKVAQFKSLLIELEKKVAGPNCCCQSRGSGLNTTVGTDDDFSKSLKKQRIISLVEKQVIVPLLYYGIRNDCFFWLTARSCFGAMLKNMGLLGIRITHGYGDGILVGTR